MPEANGDIPSNGMAIEHVNAATASMAHHGNIVYSFSTSLVNIFAVFNAGAFAAAAATISTSFGQLAKNQLWGHVFLTFTFFVIGFISSAVLMISLFQYSIRKYQWYRLMLLKGDFSATGNRQGVLVGMAIGSFVLMCISTILGISFAVYILFAVHVP